MAGEVTKLLQRGTLRASDDERERAVDGLRHHYAAGRITADELEERVHQAYRATTRGELDTLFRDLPSERGRRAAQRIERANREALRAHVTSYVGVNAGLVAIWATTGAGEFWPGFSMAFWGMFVGWHWTSARAVARRLRRPRGGRPLGGRRPPLPR
jgi:hypothetical protein